MSLLNEVLLGIYLGLLAGIVPALVAGVLGFGFKYATGVSIPALAVVLFSGALAGVSGGLMGLLDEEVAQSPRFVVAILLVMMLALYAHSQGDKLGESLPRRFSLRTLRRRTLSADVIQVVGGIGEATITATVVEGMEGYPPLSPALRDELLGKSWTFRADVPIEELESRLVDRLRTEHDLTDVTVAIDQGGSARIVAAPPSTALSRRVPDGKQAVSISALLPTGVAVGERVSITVPGASVTGTVVSARSDIEPEPTPASPVETDGGVVDLTTSGPTTAPTTAGGQGRITVAVSQNKVSTLLAADHGRVVVLPRGGGREVELLSLLRDAGMSFKRILVKEGSPLVGQTIETQPLRAAEDGAVMAIKQSAAGADGGRSWLFSPDGATKIGVGDELFVVGTPATLDGIGDPSGSGEHQ